MSNTEDEDCGCDSVDKQKLKPEDIENIKQTMDKTKETLETMLENVQGLNVDLGQFNRFEEELHKVSSYMYSGEFVKSLETLLDKTKSVTRNTRDIPNYENKMTSFRQKKETKEPIGYVWVDEDGEQKFSPVKPDDIVSMPVYGE